jgi:hypothetical protein
MIANSQSITAWIGATLTAASRRINPNGLGMSTQVIPCTNHPYRMPAACQLLL